MTTLQLNAEIYRSLGILATDENYLRKAASYLKRLVAKKESDPSLMTEEEFFAHIDEAEQQIAQGEKYEFNNSEAMNAWLNAL